MADSESRENRTTVEDIERSTPQSAQMDINELNKQNKRQLMLLKKLKFKYDDVESKNKALEASLRDKEKAFTELNLKFDTMKVEKDALADKMTLIEAENSKLSNQIKDVTEQIDCMTLKQETANETFKCLQDEIKAVQCNNTELLKQISLLSDARDSALHSLKLTKDDLKAKEEVLQQEACLANQEKLEAVKKFECLSNDFLELQFKLTDVEEKNVVISTKCQELQGQCILLSDMRETYETQINNLETCLLECKEMLQRTTAENEELKRTVEKSEIRKNEMEDHSKLQELEEQLRSVMEENVNLVEKVQTAETRAALLEQEKCRLLSDLQEDSEKQISELRRSLFECQEIMKNSIAEKEAVELKLDHSEKLRNEMEDLLSRDQAEKHSNSLEVKCEVEQLNNSLQHFKRENAELVEKSKCIINENECLQQKIQELETKAVLLQTSYNELCCKNQNLEVESEELQRTVDGLNNHLTDFAMLKAELSAKLEALNVVKNANEFLTHQVNETVSNELSLKNVVEKQRAVLEDIYGVVLSVNSEQEMKSTLPKDFQLEDILPALKRRFAVENVKVSEDKVVNTDLDENYVSSLHCIKIKDLVNEYTQAARALSELETVLQTLESRVSTCEANDRFINKHSCPAHRAETRDVFTEVEEEIIIDGTRAAPLTSHMLDTSEVNLCSTTLTRDTLERIDKFTEIIEGELTVESFRNDADHCECSCEHCALISQRLTDNNEQPKLFIEKLLSNVQILRSDRNVIDNSLRNFVRRFQELKFDGDSDICSDEVEKIKLKLDEVMISAGDSSEVDLHRELNHLDDVLTILLQCEKVVLLVLQTWNTAIHCKSLKGEEIKTKENIEIEELQRTNEMQEKKIKEVEDLVNKFKIVAVKAKKETAELKKRLNDAESEIAATVSDRDLLRSEVERLTAQLTLLDQEKISKEECIKMLDQQFSQEKEKHKITLSKLEQALKEASQSNVISLEIADYERLMKDLNKQMEAKNVEVVKLQTELQFQKEMIQSYVIQIEHLESQNLQSEARVEQLKSANKKLKVEISELRETEQQWKKSESVIIAQLETANCEVENYKLQVAEVLSANQKLQELGRVTEGAHNRVLRAHETKINALVDELQDVKNKYALCQTEYENYKIRAHSVLKHKKSTVSRDGLPASQGNKLLDADSEEKCRLEKTVEALQTKVQELMVQLSASQSELNSVQEEHGNLLQRHNRVVLNLNEQEASWKQRVERLQKELLAEQKEHSDTVRQMQHHQQLTMTSSVKQQIDALQLEHKQQLEELQEKLKISCEETTRLRQELADAKASLVNINKDDDVMLDFLNTERQEGEGSEFTDPVIGTPKHSTGYSSFVPLEQLLSPDKISDHSSLDTIEIEKLEGQLAGASKKIDHLTEILHESEATNARLSEQARVLKEEIRRLERNQEREKHFANMEYVKNVILKFFTLPSGDERERLVPVLTTILRLSPEEEQKVQGIAKVGGESQALTGWGSYLPLPRWPGSH